MRSLEDFEPLGPRRLVDLGQPVVEEVLDGGGFWVAVVWDQTHQTGSNIADTCMVSENTGFPHVSQGLFFFFTQDTLNLSTWPAKDADNLARAAAIVRDGNDVAERRAVGLAHSLKHVDQVVRRAATGEDDDAASSSRVRADRPWLGR